MNIEEDEGPGWPSSWADRPGGHSCILACVFLVTALCPHPDRTPHREGFLPVVFVLVLETRSGGVRAGRRGGGHEGCTDTSHHRLRTAENPSTSQELSLDKETLDFFDLKMNFKRIFLVKCLLLLFPSVKCEFFVLFFAQSG